MRISHQWAEEDRCQPTIQEYCPKCILSVVWKQEEINCRIKRTAYTDISRMALANYSEV